MPGKSKTMSKYYLASQITALAMVIVLFLSSASSVHAHKIHLFAWAEGNTVYTESHLGSKKKMRGGLIKVFDLSGNKVLEGKTDEKGGFSFRLPRKMDLRIVLEDTVGHRTEYVLKAGEPLQTGVGSDSPTKRRESQVPSSAVVQVDLDQISMVVEKALDAKLKPIMKTLAKIQESRAPGFSEALAGIGYIFGLLGLILYIKSKKKR